MLAAPAVSRAVATSEGRFIHIAVTGRPLIFSRSRTGFRLAPSNSCASHSGFAQCRNGEYRCR